MGGAPGVSVVVPTLREVESLRLLAPRLAAGLRGYEAEVLVVDDDSGDGTEALVADLARSGPFRLLVRRGKRGLASAVLDGLAATTGAVVVVMDADGSHPPELLPQLIEPCRTGTAEFVLASRHVPGGDDGLMRASRRFVSGGASILARPLTGVHDPMSGYFALRREILARAPLRPLGYKIGLEILVKCRPHPVREVPFAFGNRLAGASKLDSKVISHYLRHLARLYGWRLVHPFRAASTL